MLLLLSAKKVSCSALIYASCSSDFNRIKQEGSKGKMWPFVVFTVCVSYCSVLVFHPKIIKCFTKMVKL